MSAGTFSTALAKVLVHEGGYVNDSRDPGGATNKGVTQGVYDQWRASRGLPKRPVSQLSDDEIALIYRGRFWDTVRGDDLPPGVDYVVFDGSVNSGPAQSAKWLQRAVGVTADGKVGPETLDAARAATASAVIDTILEQRLAFLKKIKHRDTGALLWTTFGKGWQRRVDDVRRDAHAMVAAKGPQKPAQPAPAASGTDETPITLPNAASDRRTGIGAAIAFAVVGAIGLVIARCSGAA